MKISTEPSLKQVILYSIMPFCFITEADLPTFTRRASPVCMASSASFITIDFTQPPPTQPMISPYLLMMALSPLLPEHGASLRTTIAIAKGSFFFLSSWAFVKNCSSIYQIFFQFHKAFQIVCRTKLIDHRQCCIHASCNG